MFFRYCFVFESFIVFALSFLFLHIVQSNASKLNDFEILKTLRPLKYAGVSCKTLCQNITCQVVEECEDGVILKNATYCGCCESCVKFLNIGASCTEVIKDALALGSQSRCKKGTICKEGKCVLNLEEKTCLRHKDIVKKHIEMEKYESEIWIPQCDKEGYYAAKQNKITKSFCFNKSGKRIFGSADDLFDNTCGCSRYIEETIKNDPLQFHVKPHEHCSSAGSFDTLQCIGNLCYCADVNTGDIKSELVRIDFLQNLNCSADEEIQPKDYLRDCEKELHRTKKQVYEFWKKGVIIHGLDRVACDPDGTFAPRQANQVVYVCTDKKGHGIESYKEEITKITKDRMTCNCARDVHYNPFHTFSCETYGSYQSVTCFSDKCVCVDEDGETIEPKKLKDLDTTNQTSYKPNLFCKKVFEELLEYPSNNPIDNGFTDDDYSSEYDV